MEGKTFTYILLVLGFIVNFDGIFAQVGKFARVREPLMLLGNTNVYYRDQQFQIQGSNFETVIKKLWKDILSIQLMQRL